MERAGERLRHARADWWTDRISYAAEVLDVDPEILLAEWKRHRWMPSTVLVEWPPGLRLDDEPRIEDFW